jgi:putative N-acetylmannosamine-6-phosphate epimerase
MEPEQYNLKIKKQQDIYATITELADTKCDIICCDCPFVIRPDGTTCVKRMVKDLMSMHEISKNV